MPLTEDTVREALRKVIDPELFVNIIDLGLVYTVTIGEAPAAGACDSSAPAPVSNDAAPSPVDASPVDASGAAPVDALSAASDEKVSPEPATSPVEAAAEGCCGGGHHAASPDAGQASCSTPPLVSLDQSNSERHHVAIEMTLTSPMCPAGPQLIGQSKQFVLQLPEVESVEVRIVMDPPWSPDRMTEDARDQLGIF